MLNWINGHKKLALKICLVLAVLFSVHGLIKDINNTDQYMVCDFRNRVVAARLLDADIDPYFFRWTPDYPETYLNPWGYPDRPVSMVTVTPAVLLIQSTFSDWNYKSQKFLWLSLEWAALLLSLLFMSLSLRSRNKKLFVWIIGLGIFAGGWFWRFHVDAGQMYIFYVLLISAAYYIFSRDVKSDTFLAGVILGFLASMRPNAIVFCLPFLVLKKNWSLLGTALGALISLTLSISAWGISPWLSYLKAVKIHGQIHSGLLQVSTIPNSVVYGLKELEGVSQFYVPPRMHTDSSIQGIFPVPSGVLVIALAIALLIYLAFLIRHREKIQSVEMIFLAGITAVIISEFFIPATRYGYYDVIWLIPLCLLIIKQEKDPSREGIAGIIFLLPGICILLIGNNIVQAAVAGPLILLLFTVYTTIINARGYILKEASLQSTNIMKSFDGKDDTD